MDRTFVLLQLAFNILMFTALAVLAWRMRERRPARGASRGGARAPEAHREPTPAALPLPPALAELVDRAEEKELAAEAALRARLSRFRERAAV